MKAVHNNVLALSSLLVPMEEGAVMATLDEHSEQSTIKGIRQLLSAVQTLHHNSSSDSSVKEIMEHLESVDVNFHRYSTNFDEVKLWRIWPLSII